MAIGNLIGGILSDRWSREWVFSLGSDIGVLGIWCFSALTGPHDLVLLVIYAAAGLGFGMRIPLLTAIPADLFAGRHFGAILGFTNGGCGLGGFIGPFLAGYLFTQIVDFPPTIITNTWGCFESGSTRSTRIISGKLARRRRGVSRFRWRPCRAPHRARLAATALCHEAVRSPSSP